jgi:hypothetical protein
VGRHWAADKPDDWSVHVNDLKKRGVAGRDKAYRILKRLVEQRYMHRTRMIDAKTGQFRGYEYEIRDEPSAPVSPENLEETPCPESQEADHSDVQPSPDTPYTADQDSIIKQTNTNAPLKRDPPPEVSKCSDNPFVNAFDTWPAEPTRPQARAIRMWRAKFSEQTKMKYGFAGVPT